MIKIAVQIGQAGERHRKDLESATAILRDGNLKIAMSAVVTEGIPLAPISIRKLPDMI